MTNPSALVLVQPLDIDDARQAARELASQRRHAEQWHRELTEQSAEAERDYRRALAEAIVNLTPPDGAKWTAAQREAAARGDVADLSFQRDLKAGMVKVAAERLRGLEGERSMLKTLMEWSSRAADVTVDGSPSSLRSAA